MPFRAPFGPPPRAPWKRQTVQPRTAGALQGRRERWLRSTAVLSQRNTPASMRSSRTFPKTPSSRNSPDDRLTTSVHGDVLNSDPLLSPCPIALQRLYLPREGPGKLVEGPLSAVLLGDILHMSEPARKRYRGQMYSSHLRRQHGLDFVSRLDPFTIERAKLVPLSSTLLPDEPIFTSCEMSPLAKSTCVVPKASINSR